MRRTLLSALALLIAAAPLSAGDSFELPVEGSILHGWQQADGTRMAAVRLALAPGWKTYWRAPGDAGIPPQFDWSGSRNLASVGIHWPAPVVFLTAGLQTIGYEGELVLPLTLTPRGDGPVRLETTLDIGVCSDICIPHRMSLSAVIDGSSQNPTPVIAAALASRPYSGREAGARDVACTLAPTSDGLEITATASLPDTGGKEVVVIEPGVPGVWVSQTKTTRKGRKLTAVGEMIAADGEPLAIDRSDIVITVLGRDQAVEMRGCAPG